MNEHVRIPLSAQPRGLVIDTTAPGFAEEFRRQARLICAADDENDILAFVEASVDTEAWNA